jgi:hypothetical protein
MRFIGEVKVPDATDRTRVVAKKRHYQRPKSRQRRVVATQLQASYSTGNVKMSIACFIGRKFGLLNACLFCPSQPLIRTFFLRVSIERFPHVWPFGISHPRPPANGAPRHVVEVRTPGSSVTFPVLSKERHPLSGRPAHVEIQHGLRVALRMLLAPQLEQERRHVGQNRSGAMTLA